MCGSDVLDATAEFGADMIVLYPQKSDTSKKYPQTKCSIQKIPILTHPIMT